METMQPIAGDRIPRGAEWIYEVKYDGFRGMLSWDRDTVQLLTRNGTDISDRFPEIIEGCNRLEPYLDITFPVKLDGEITVLNSDYQADFRLLQKRVKLKAENTIRQASVNRPATFLAFDLLQENTIMKNETLGVRKERLFQLGDGIRKYQSDIVFLDFIPAHTDPDALWQEMFLHRGEGIIAKRKDGKYMPGKQHHDWLKIKNWRKIKGFLSDYNKNNGYFSINVYNGQSVQSIGKCKHGFSREKLDQMQQFFISRGSQSGDIHSLPPAICAHIHTLDLYEDKLREPQFAELLTELEATDCTTERMHFDLAMFPPSPELTNLDKVFWPRNQLTKEDLLLYMRYAAPHMLPFLRNRALTVIRSPDGVEGEQFFQKNMPDYVPSFVREESAGDNIQCGSLETLLWWSNHGTIEFHIPFTHIGKKEPAEIVFDLDPPSQDHFSLAIESALIIKQLLDDLKLTSFIKTSGKKGMQIHIPLPSSSLTYNDTSLLTKAIAETTVRERPDLFTTQRMKAKRGNRLYIDHVQHAPGKTIIAPYSPRLDTRATIATPLYWEEVKAGLTPDAFTITNTVERIREKGCPFRYYGEAGNRQDLEPIRHMMGT